jgi:hypothetical protein
MNFVQLDKNTGDKRLRDACLKDGVVTCDLLPKEVRDEEDDVVLQYVIDNQFVMFTFDRRIHFEWGHLLAGCNPGILILRKDDDSLQQINTRTAPKHLSNYKDAFPDWHTVPYRHSVVEVTPSLVIVYHTLGQMPVRTWWAERTQTNWQQTLQDHLNANAKGRPL